MNYGVLGSGMVGQAIAAKLASRGHEVVIGTRNPGKLADWLAATPGKVRAGSFAEAAAHGELLFNATSGAGSLEALKLAGEENLAGKALVDISNPLDYSRGWPPTLFVSNTDSLGEQIQRAFPEVRVVKSLNTLNASLMVDPQSLANGDHTVFVSGNDAAAKARVSELLRSEFGWKDIIDVGDITASRGMEAVLHLWLRLYGVFESSKFQFKVVPPE